MIKTCQVCGETFKDGDKLAAVMLSEYKEIESDVHFAITHPTGCLEIFHIECYDGDDQYGPREPIEIN
jgi:hypothetical protein